MWGATCNFGFWGASVSEPFEHLSNVKRNLKILLNLQLMNVLLTTFHCLSNVKKMYIPYSRE